MAPIACGAKTSSVLSGSSPAEVAFNAETENGTSMDPDAEPSAGSLNAALANEIVRLVARFTGRGASRSRAFVHRDVVVCLLDNGATPAERNLVAAGETELVRSQRDALSRALAPQLVAAVERLTGRTVLTALSGANATLESTVEVFVLEPVGSDS